MRSTVRLTGQGYGAMIVGAAIGVLGLRLGYASVAGFGFALLGFVLCAVVTLRKLPPLDLRREASPPDPERLAECTVTLKVRSRGTRAVRLYGVELMGGAGLRCFCAVPPARQGRPHPLSGADDAARPGRARAPAPAAARVGRPGDRGVEPAGEAWVTADAPGSAGRRSERLADGAGRRPRRQLPADTLHFDEAVDVAASLAAAAAAAGTPFVVRTMSLPSLAGSTGGAADGAEGRTPPRRRSVGWRRWP